MFFRLLIDVPWVSTPSTLVKTYMPFLLIPLHDREFLNTRKNPSSLFSRTSFLFRPLLSFFTSSLTVSGQSFTMHSRTFSLSPTPDTTLQVLRPRYTYHRLCYHQRGVLRFVTVSWFLRLSSVKRTLCCWCKTFNGIRTLITGSY